MTDKERLEEAKLMAEMLRVETRLPHDFPFDLVDWLVEQSERVQELETTVDFYQSALRDADRRVQELKSRIADDEHFVAEILEQNKRYREAIKDIKKTWKNPHNPYNQLDEIHEIIKELEGEK